MRGLTRDEKKRWLEQVEFFIRIAGKATDRFELIATCTKHIASFG